MKLPTVSFSRREAVRVAIPVLALVLVASVVTGRETPSHVPPEPASHLQKRIASEKLVSDADLDLERLKRPAREEDKVATAADPFARRSFGAAPGEQAPAAPEQPAVPQVPPLPFTYLGKVIEDGKLSVFLGRGEDSFSLSAGKRQKLDDQYRVDKVTESAVVFTYLPMNARQTLDIPAVNQ
ncbi:MAG TPA: hypothetical protein VG873_12430 [Burkholderiales bacterium]|nr:hypothetical protein [Burkholderiales bacterium]